MNIEAAINLLGLEQPTVSDQPGVIAADEIAKDRFSQVVEALITSVSEPGDQEANLASPNHSAAWLKTLLNFLDQSPAPAPPGATSPPEQAEAISLTGIMAALQPLINQNMLMLAGEQGDGTASPVQGEDRSNNHGGQDQSVVETDSSNQPNTGPG